MRSLHIHLVNSPDSEVYWIRPAEVHAHLAGLVQKRKLSLAVTESQDADTITETMLDADVVIGFKLPHTLIHELPKLRWIHLTSAGVDHLLPLDWLPPHVALTNSSGVHADLGGEYALCALLMLSFGMPRHMTSQRRGQWRQVFNTPAYGKTVVLIGVGAIGGAAARQAKRMGLHVIGVRLSRSPHRHVDEMFGPESLPDILPRADFVVVTAPLTPRTRGMVGRRELDMLKPTAGLVNMSRAGLVDYTALAEKLERGELRGAIVDVCDPEPYPRDGSLWHVPNLVITPHISSDPVDYTDRTLAIFEGNLRRLLASRPLLNSVERDRGY